MHVGETQLEATGKAAAAAVERDREIESYYVGLVRTYHAGLVAYVFSMVPQIQVAEDLTQDSFLKAYLALPKMGLPDNPRAWLYRIATNVTIDYLRRQRRIGWVAIDKLIHALRGADPTERIDIGDPVNRAMASLTPDQQSVLMLFSRAGLKAPEVAEVLNISPAAARKRRQRAREAFIKAYKLQTEQEPGDAL